MCSDSITSYNGHCTLWVPLRKYLNENFKYFVSHLNKMILNILVGQEVLQITQISKLCVTASMSYCKWTIQLNAAALWYDVPVCYSRLKAAAYVTVRPSVLVTVKPDNNNNNTIIK